jgi:hypothetical protein
MTQREAIAKQQTGAWCVQKPAAKKDHALAETARCWPPTPELGCLNRS